MGMSVKEELLKELLEHDGNFFSGEELAKRLHCSRTAVWKAVKSLNDQGYEIEAVPNKGYALAAKKNVLSQIEIERYLSAGEGKEKEGPEIQLQVYPEISSTNDVLKQLANEMQAPEGMTLVSDYQTGGRGRMGRSFYSPKGSGLYLSMLLRPEGSVMDNLILTAQASVAVYRAVKKVCQLELGIKWVNDLYLEGKKVCGILSEGQANFESGILEYVIVGIGLNIFLPQGGFPEEIRNRAGTLYPMSYEAYESRRNGGDSASSDVRSPELPDRNRLAAEIIREFYTLSKETGLAEEYREKNLVPGHAVNVISGTESRPAFATRILEDGRLEVREEDGSLTPLVYGEVSIRLQGEEEHPDFL